MNDARKAALADVERIAREVASELGLEVVEFVFRGQGRHSQLRIDIDRPGLPGVGIADCERLSRALDERLEALEFVESTYELQVSSPGIDRPIRSDDDIRRNAGRLVRAEFTDDSGKVQVMTGILAGPEGATGIRIETADGAISISRNDIVLMKQDVSTGRRKRDER